MGSVDAAILSCSFGRVLDKFASPILKEFQSGSGAEKDLKKLGSKLSKIQAVLTDADQKQKVNALVKEWLVDVRDLVCDAEDLLELCATYRQWNQVCNSSHASSSSTIVDFIKKFDIEPSFTKIIEKSDELARHIDDLCLKADVVAGQRIEIVRGERETSSLVDESQVFGRESDKNKIVDLLLSDGPSGGDEIGVLPIVGMGGLGKTTLAKYVYNDERVEKHFDVKGWVCVSEEVDVRRITKDILESITKDACNLVNLDSLQVKLKDALKGKRFFIVLDDIWNENPNDWEALRTPFKFGKQGSKIMVSTQSAVVARILGTISAYSLGVLTYDDCWKLFMQSATIDNKYLSARPNLKAIGVEIVGKCKGLPLAVKTLGSLLRFKTDENYWKDILRTDIWDIPEGENFVLRILRLSYQHLPSYLKQCFVYCSIFPKDYLFEKEMLVWLWMAEGFVHSLGRKQMEDIGSGYFDELFSRSFFQSYSNYGESRFVMHDLVHDLAKSISRETCIALDGDKFCKTSEKTLYASLVCVKRSQQVAFDAFYNAKRLRTFILLSPTSTLPHDLFFAWRCLRALSLSYLPIRELPESISNLRLLRYLDLDGTLIQTLPESICTLYNLQTLILSDYITELPTGLHSLINLQHVRIVGPNKTPRGIGALTSLLTLSDFVVGESNGTARLRELKELINLRGQLHISGLQNVVDVMDAKEATLENKQHLYKLTLEWTGGRDIDSGEEKRVGVEEIIECLQPHKNLKELSIDSYSGIYFPSWISMLSSLVHLNLSCWKGIQVLPPLGHLPLLKYFALCDMENVKCVSGCEFYGEGFPSLEKLIFQGMPEWEEWSSIVEDDQEEEGEELFPRLASLTIEDCPKLIQLPFYWLSSLDELYIYGCVELTTLPRLRIPSHVSGYGDEFPCLRELEIYFCHKLRQLPHLLPSLAALKIEGCRQLSVLPRLPLLHHLDLRECYGKRLFMRVGPLPSLTHLFISEIRRLKYLTEEFFLSLTSLEELTISACKDLKVLGSEVMGLRHLVSLQRLMIHGCGKLILSFPKEEEGLPTKLQYLSLRLLNKLEILPQLHNLTSLVELEIRMVPWLTSFPKMGLPPKLRKLEIGECKSLKSLPRGLHNLTCLEEMKVDGCPGLSSFTATESEEGGIFPPSLKSLHIEGCKNLKELSRNKWIHYNPTSTNKRCRTTTALEEIWIKKCKKLESLPTRMRNLTSLKVLSIVRCPRMVAFPEEGLPTKLRELEIGGCGHCFDNLPKRIGLHRLTSLEKLTISWCSGFVSFPKEEEEEEWQPPPILRKISFKYFKSLEFFRPKWLHNLTSLQKLHILYAPKLMSLPEEGLPTMLQYLEISNCPLLKQSCHKEGGIDWSKISHIPDIKFMEEEEEEEEMFSFVHI